MDLVDEQAADIENLISRVEFFDSCIEQVRREVPLYLHKQAGLDKHNKAMAKILRSVGSSETNQRLQNVLFHYSQKHEIFEKERSGFSRCEQNLHAIADDAKKLLVIPLKEIIADHKALSKANPSLGSANNTGGKSTATTKVTKSDISDAQFVQSTLQVHVKLFEKHRVQSMKKLLQSLLSAELRYHCRVVEELSSVLQDLALVDENDDIQNQNQVDNDE